MPEEIVDAEATEKAIKGAVCRALDGMEKKVKSMRKAVERFDLLTAAKRQQEFWDMCFEISSRSPEHADYERQALRVKVIEGNEDYLYRFRDCQVSMNELRVRLESHNWIVQRLAHKHIL